MKQEDNFIEVKTNLWNRVPIRWIIPVRIKKLRLLFDVYAWVFVGRNSGLDFNQIEEMDPGEFLTWSVYGAHASYLSTIGKRLTVDVETVQGWVRGILAEDRERIIRVIMESKAIGETAQAYQKGKMSGDKKDGESKKDNGSDQRS